MYNIKFATLGLCATTVLAFPAAVDKTARQVPVFSENQLVSTSGVHKFVPPDFEAGDQRGPCPGLNALANHGYLPHSGVGTIQDFALSTLEVFGLGIDVGEAFGLYGALSAGDGLTWSIGGPPANTVALPGLLSAPKGISFSHNEYEGDASATRNDLYSAGNDYKINMQYFTELYNQLPAKSFNALSKHRNQRVQQSIMTNPYFFSGPFTGIAISGGANNFVWRLAANHSKEYPEGYLSKEVFATFWSVNKNKNGELEWKEGWDRIPDNWYRRPLVDQYTIPAVAADLATYFKQHPSTVVVGGNMGKVNTFAGLDLTNATGGVFNAEDFGKGNNAACFAYQAGALLAPDMLAKTFGDITGPLKKLEDAFGKMLAPLNCPKLKNFDQKALARYPGYSQSYNGYKGLGN